MKTKIYIFILVFIFLNLNLNAQEIHIRTVPIIASNQGDFQPSLSRGMGNLSIAFNDSISDLFTNPARGAMLKGLTLFFSPTRNSWSNEDGNRILSNWGSDKYTGVGINSLPFGLFLKKDNFFAGGTITYQSYSSERNSHGNFILDSSPFRNSNKEDKGDNTFLFGLAGIYIPDLKVSIAGSFSWSKYKAIDGVDLLYPGSLDIKQDGWAANFKFGLTGELSERDRLDLVIGRNVFKSSHEIVYQFWGIRDWVGLENMIGGYRSELNKDESNGWVIHTNYNRQLNGKWKIGAIFTLNWKEHPKIPNYSLANIPRDPGYSTAFNIGAGFFHTGEKADVGFEYIYQPITSYTWAEPDEFSFYPATFKTVENYFDFYNHIFRGGILTRTEFKWLDFRLGAQLHFFKYNLKQDDNIRLTSREAEENWLETTLSGGVTFKFTNVKILYSLQVILGNGIVSTETSGISVTSFAAEKSSADFLIAPAGSLAVDDIPLITQQITFLFSL